MRYGISLAGVSWVSPNTSLFMMRRALMAFLMKESLSFRVYNDTIRGGGAIDLDGSPASEHGVVVDATDDTQSSAENIWGEANARCGQR